MKDLPLSTLLEMREKVAADIPENLVKHCYEIEKNHLFEKDREKPLEMIKEMVAQFIENEAQTSRGNAK